MWRVRCLAVTVALLLAGGCAADRDPAAVAPTFTVQGDGDPIVLRAWSFCNDHMCADGAPPESPPSVGRTDSVTVRFSEPDWTLTAEFQTPDDSCGRVYEVPLTRAVDGEWVLHPAGPAGTYDVTLGAAGNPNGSAVTTFRWTTHARGTMPAPAAQLLTRYFELHVSNLASTPKRGSLTVTVTAVDGKTTVIRPEQSRHEGEGPTCAAPGRIDFYARDTDTEPEFGTPPLQYDVHLTLDGADYRAGALVPQDTKNDGHEHVNLAFTPPLPAFTG